MTELDPCPCSHWTPLETFPSFCFPPPGVCPDNHSNCFPKATNHSPAPSKKSVLSCLPHVNALDRTVTYRRAHSTDPLYTWIMHHRGDILHTTTEYKCSTEHSWCPYCSAWFQDGALYSGTIWLYIPPPAICPLPTIFATAIRLPVDSELPTALTDQATLA